MLNNIKNKNKIMKANYKIGDKFNLLKNGKIREFEIKLESNNEFKIFNKFELSFWANEEFLNNNIVK